MAFRSTSAVAPVNDDVASGAGLDVFNDANLATVGAVALGATTAGGALFVGAAVAPAQVLTGLAAAGTLGALGAHKAEHGSYLPFFNKKEEENTSDAPAPAAA